MKKKVIKKYQEGNRVALDPTYRKALIQLLLVLNAAIELYYKEHPEEREKLRHGEFAFRPVRYALGVEPYMDNSTRLPILNGENILTRNGTVVTGQSLDWLDWLAETGLVLPGQSLPELQVEYNKKTKDTSTRVGEDWEDMNNRKDNAPIATSELWELLALQNFDANDIIKLNLKRRLADREANAKTPGVGSLALLGTIGPMAAWNPLAFFTSLGGAKLGEETLNFAFLLLGYNSFGDWLFEGTSAPEWLRSNSNVGTFLGGGAGWSLANKYLAMTKNLIKHTTQDALKKSILSNYYKLAPRLIEDVLSTEVSSVLKSALPEIKTPMIFEKVGETNKGSVLSLAVNNLKKAFKDAFSNDPVWSLMERAGIPESLRVNVEKTLFGPKIPEGGRVYIDPATNVKYPLADPGMTDEELSKAFLDGLRDSYRQFRSPEYKTKLLLRLNWDESKYNEFIQELNSQQSSPFSVEVKGADELGYYFALVVQRKDGSKTFKINRDRIGAELSPGMSVLLRLKEAGLHEGYHASTGGNDGSHGMRATLSDIRSKYPRLTEIIDHNVGLLDDNVDYNEWVKYFRNTPRPLIVQDLKDAGFTQKEIEYALEIGIPRANNYNKYVDTVLEFGARNFTSNFFDGPSENLQLLQNIFTEKAINSVNGKLLSKAGEINEGSAVGVSRRPILRKNMHEFSDAEWDAAYEAALGKGNKREMWRLLTLRFLLKAKEYVANGGGDPIILWRGLYREPVHTMKPSGVWLSSDKNYALNFTKDKNDSSPTLDERKVYPYFVKGHLETLFPHNTYYDLPESLRTPHNYDWSDLYQELIWRVPKNFRLYAENIDNAVSFSVEHGATSNDIKNTFFKNPVRNRIYDFGKADVIAGHDMPMNPSIYPNWIPSQGLEYNVKNPSYVKLAKLITYDDNGNMIPLSLRFNFRYNDRRYGWLLPLIPFLYTNKKDQAD